MHIDYPIERRARHRVKAWRPVFVSRAKSILEARDGCLPREFNDGLTLLARNEEALAEHVSVLRDVFGATLELGPIQVRLTGDPPHEPIMNVRINIPITRDEAVKGQLRRRSVSILQESRGGTRCLLQGEAPLTKLLGLDADLKYLTLGCSLLWTSLARYAPCSLDPEPLAA